MNSIYDINKGIMEGDFDRVSSHIMVMRHCLGYRAERINDFLEKGLEHAVQRYSMCHDKKTGKISRLTKEYIGEFGKIRYCLKDLVRAGKTFKLASQMAESFLPYTFEEAKDNGIIGIGTLINQHFIGRTVVQQRLRFAGYACYELGSKLKAMDFIRAAEEKSLDVIGVSLMAETKKYKPLSEFMRLMNELDNSKLSKNVQVIVGGQASDRYSSSSNKVHKIPLDMLVYFTGRLVETSRK